jgi:hypothetical protein
VPNSNGHHIASHRHSPHNCGVKRFLPLLLGLCSALALSAAEPTPPRIIRSADGQMLTLDYPSEEIAVILHDVAAACDLGLIVPEIYGRTSVKLRNVTWRQVFNEVLTPQRYTWAEDPDAVRVCDIAALGDMPRGMDAFFPKSDSPTDRHLSIDFANEDIRTILRNVADLFELNLVIPDSLGGRQTVRLKNVTWRQIFRDSLNPIGYTFSEDQGIVRVLARPQARIGTTLAESSPRDPFERGLRWFRVATAALPFTVILPVALLHLFLFVGVVRTPLAGPARFAPKTVWAVFVLLGGVLPLLAYW